MKSHISRTAFSLVLAVLVGLIAGVYVDQLVHAVGHSSFDKATAAMSAGEDLVALKHMADYIRACPPALGGKCTPTGGDKHTTEVWDTLWILVYKNVSENQQLHEQAKAAMRWANAAYGSNGARIPGWVKPMCTIVTGEPAAIRFGLEPDQVSSPAIVWEYDQEQYDSRSYRACTPGVGGRLDLDLSAEELLRRFRDNAQVPEFTIP